MEQAELEQIIEKARVGGFTRLDLGSGEIIKALPDSIGNLSCLTHLYLNFSQLNKLPDTIGNLSNLTTLAIYNNELNLLPDSIGNLVNLSVLELRDNQLKKLPDSSRDNL